MQSNLQAEHGHVFVSHPAYNHPGGLSALRLESV